MRARDKVNYRSFMKFVTLIATEGSGSGVRAAPAIPRRLARHEIAPVGGEEQQQFWGGEGLRTEGETWREETQDILNRLTKALWSEKTSHDDFARHLSDARKLQAALRSHETDATLPASNKSGIAQHPTALTGGKRTIAAIQNQVASAPGQHGVPFRTGGGARLNHATGAPRALAAPPRTDQRVPPPTATREEIQSFIGSN